MRCAGVKGGFVKQQDFRANLTMVRFALREMAQDLRDRHTWLVIGGIILLVAVAGPFYTLENLGLPGRIGYWGVVGVLSWLMMWALVRIAFAMTPGHWPDALVGGLAGLAGVVPMMGLVAAANLAAGMGMPQAGFWGFAPYVGPPVVGISILAVLLVPDRDGPPKAPGPDTPGGLFARMPPDLGRDIIALRAQDHYVQVTTPRGSDLVLMRMSDAVDDLKAFDGMQIHRSWWINLDHVSRLAKEAGRVRLVLDNGLVVPVPRSRQADLRRAIAARQTRGRHRAPS